jgi:predicted outer membrane repeat protein
MSDILRQVRKKFKKKGIVPQWICPNLFKELQAYWESPEFVEISNKAKKNRASEKGGCIYAGGSISVAEHGVRLVKTFTTLFVLLFI